MAVHLTPTSAAGLAQTLPTHSPYLLWGLYNSLPGSCLLPNHITRSSSNQTAFPLPSTTRGVSCLEKADILETAVEQSARLEPPGSSHPANVPGLRAGQHPRKSPEQGAHLPTPQPTLRGVTVATACATNIPLATVPSVLCPDGEFHTRRGTDPHILKVQVIPHHQAPLPLLFLRHSLQEWPGLRGWLPPLPRCCKRLSELCGFLAGSKGQAPHQLETTTETRAAAAAPLPSL